jgi:hypothetical protein
MRQTTTRSRASSAEDAIQAEIIGLLKVASIHDLIYFHPANGGKRPISTARRLKDIGVVAGVPDLVMIHPETGVTYFVEVKTDKGSLSKEQRAFRDRCLSLGHPWALVRSRDQFQDVATEWGLLRITKKIGRAA